MGAVARKNGICVCADTRYQIKNSDGSVINNDGNNKIYKFNSENISLIIFNHGVNKFGNKSWKDFCSDYEKTNRWRNKSPELICNDFKNFIESHITKQLEYNIRNMPNANSVWLSAFGLCAKNLTNNNFEFYELCWSPKFALNFWKDTRLICSGEGYKYLEKYLEDNKRSNTVEFWRIIDIIKAERKLKKLFSIAVNEKQKLNGQEFSDDCNTKCITL